MPIYGVGKQVRILNSEKLFGEINVCFATILVSIRQRKAYLITNKISLSFK